MLFSLLSASLLAISAFALPPRYPAIRSLGAPVSWVTAPEVIPADTDLRLEWQGGDGYGWQVYYIPQWPSQSVYHVSYLLPTLLIADQVAGRHCPEHNFNRDDLAYT